MSSSPNDFSRVIEENRKLIKQNKKLREENQRLRANQPNNKPGKMKQN